MSLINIENSKSIWGTVANIQIKSGYGSVYWVSADDISNARINSQVINLSNGLATVGAARAVASNIDSILNHKDERTLYTFQAMLNDTAWQECNLEVSANFVHATGLAIGIKSMWQEAI